MFWGEVSYVAAWEAMAFAQNRRRQLEPVWPRINCLSSMAAHVVANSFLSTRSVHIRIYVYFFFFAKRPKGQGHTLWNQTLQKKMKHKFLKSLISTDFIMHPSMAHRKQSSMPPLGLRCSETRVRENMKKNQTLVETEPRKTLRDRIHNLCPLLVRGGRLRVGEPAATVGDRGESWSHPAGNPKNMLHAMFLL
jgi:hypothetical protein